MKRCPKCNFSFADFHDVCDFDGTDLVDEPATLPVSPGVSALAAATQSPFLRLIKSPVFLTVLGLTGVLSSLLLIVYYDATSRSNSIAGNQPPQNSIVSPVPPAQTSVQPPAQIKTRATSSQASVLSNSKRTEKSSSTSSTSSPSRSATGRRPATALRSRARLHSPASARNQPGRSPLRKESKETADKKEPKLVAMLKTTWHILKKPFKF